MNLLDKATSLLVLLLCLIILSNCSIRGKSIGKTALPENLLSTRTTETVSIWKTDDLTVEYVSKETDNSLHLSGKVIIADRITYSYPVAYTFSIFANLIDSNGQIKSRQNLKAQLGAYSAIPDAIPFERIIPKDPSINQFAFSYSGIFKEKSRGRWADEIILSHQPF